MKKIITIFIVLMSNIVYAQPKLDTIELKYDIICGGKIDSCAIYHNFAVYHYYGVAMYEKDYHKSLIYALKSYNYRFDPETSYLIALLYIAKNDYNTALKYCRGASYLYKGEVLCGLCYSELLAYNCALYEYSLAINIDNKKAIAYYYRALTNIKIKNYMNAEKDLIYVQSFNNEYQDSAKILLKNLNN